MTDLDLNPVETNERFNSLTHLVGLILAVMGALILIYRSSALSSLGVIAGVMVFSVAMVMLYAASTAYHSANGPRKQWCAKADHCAIYLMIAGTYTPFGMRTVGSPWGALMFVLIWIVAATGILKEFGALKSAKPSLSLYFVLGWFSLCAVVPLLLSLPGTAWIWLVLGGLLYTLGIPFYLDKKWAHAHGVWHLFVLGGTSTHFFAVLHLVE